MEMMVLIGRVEDPVMLIVLCCKTCWRYVFERGIDIKASISLSDSISACDENVV